MNKDMDTTLKDVVEEIRKVQIYIAEIVTWQRFENTSKLRDLLERELSTPERKLVYDLTDGSNSRRDIAKQLSISDDSVRSMWDRWSALGIVQESQIRKGRPMKIVSLGNIGIRTPRTKTDGGGGEAPPINLSEEDINANRS